MFKVLSMAMAYRTLISLISLSFILLPTCFADTHVGFGQKLLAIEKMADKSQALTQLEQLLENETLSPLHQLSALTAQGQLHQQLGQLDKAIESAKAEQKFANELNFKRPEADAYKRIGVYAYYKGDNTLALESYKKALNYYLTIDEPIAQANLHNNIALVYGTMGSTEKALDSYQQAEPLYQQFGSNVDKIDIKFNIAIFHLQLKRFDIAITMFKDVIEKREAINDEVGLAAAYGDLGSAYKYAGDFEQALYYMTKSLAARRSTNDHYNAAALLHNLAELNNYLSNTEQAIEYAKEGIIKSKAQGHNKAYVGSLYSLAKGYFHQGKFDLALSYIKQSSLLSNEMHYKEQVKHNLALQALIYAAKNETLKAVASHRQFIQANIELANDQLNTKLALFDSEQLKQEVDQLKQQKRLQELEIERSEHERNFIIIVVVLALLIGFLIARRDIERRSTQELESKVKQRTNELEYLMQELQSANNIKSQFLANMSHEIRTPLTTVIGQAEAIINGDVDEKYITKEVEIIHGNSLHLLELTNNILDLSKIEANKIELELQSLDLHSILQELANMFTLQATSKGLTFEIVHSLPLPFYIEIDGFRVKQILINLCSNAIKFTQKGHVELKILQQDNRLIFKITDSGIGMSSSQLHHLFESFTQGDSSISRRFGGTGLGLCLSDQLAKIMGGTIEVESELNQGSEFAFSLPCEIDLENTGSESKVIVSESEAYILKDQLQGTILLADDHNDNRRLIARLLASLGLNVITACNGREAVSLFEQHEPKLTLMDIQMPEMDGIEAFKVIRQKGGETPIFALTANAMSHEIEHYLALGFNGHLSKPIERDIFIPTIAGYYEGEISAKKAKESFNQVAMSDLVQEFKSNLVLEQQDLILHINNDDIEKLARLSHRIAGAAQMFGFADLSKYALQLEMAIKNDQTNIVNAHAQDLLNEIDQVLW